MDKLKGVVVYDGDTRTDRSGTVFYHVTDSEVRIDKVRAGGLKKTTLNGKTTYTGWVQVSIDSTAPIKRPPRSIRSKKAPSEYADRATNLFASHQKMGSVARFEDREQALLALVCLYKKARGIGRVRK